MASINTVNRIRDSKLLNKVKEYNEGKNKRKRDDKFDDLEPTTSSSENEKLKELSFKKHKNKLNNYLKIISWNVNGIRAFVKKKASLDFLRTENADIICFQEIKCSENVVPKELNKFDNFDHYWNFPNQKSNFSGVAVFTKIKPINVFYGIENDVHDREGRAITCEFENFYLVNVYVTNASRHLVNLEKKRNWNEVFEKFLKKLDKKKPVVVCGDFNVAHNEIDIKNPKSNKKNAGFTSEEREDFTKLLDNGFFDSFRYLYPKKITYTFWSNRMNSRKKNIGWRLDYFVLSISLKSNLIDSIIRDDIYGSDHCPITLIIDI